MMKRYLKEDVYGIKIFLKALLMIVFHPLFISRYKVLPECNGVTGVKDMIFTNNFDASVIFDELARTISSLRFRT